jgi:two-component system response regulator
VQAYDLGANSFIRKPVLFDAFYATMKTVELYWVLTNTLPPMSRPAQQTSSNG